MMEVTTAAPAATGSAIANQPRPLYAIYTGCSGLYLRRRAGAAQQAVVPGSTSQPLDLDFRRVNTSLPLDLDLRLACGM